MIRPLLALVAAAVLVGCGPPPPPEVVAERRAEHCVNRFQDYDRLARFSSVSVDPLGVRRSDPTIERALELHRLGCVTLDSRLTTALDAPPAPIAATGAAIPPTMLHVGVVTNDAAATRVRAAYEARGIPTRQVGAEALGLRLYAGPFSTSGALDAAAALARDFGFIAPYAPFYTF